MPEARTRLQTYPPSDGGSRITGIIGILLGVFTIVALVSFGYLTATTPLSTPENTLSQFNTSQNQNAFLALGTSLFAVFAIAFAGGFSGIVRAKSQSVSSAAAVLVAAGALTLAISYDVEIGSLFAITQAPTTSVYASDATYFAAVVANLTNFLDLLDFLLIGIGLLLFSWTIWKGEIFPKWLSYVLLVGGALGVLAALPPTNPVALGCAALVGVWGFGAGRVLLRTKTVAVPEK